MMYNYWNNSWNSRQITPQAAAQIALQQIPGQVIKIELDTENGILVYEVDIATAYGIYEVQVNAGTGAIVKIGFDND